MCLAKLKMAFYVIEVNPLRTPPLPLFFPYISLTIQIIESTYCNEIFHEQAIMRKQYENHALLIHLQNLGWDTLPLIVITAGIHGIIHQPSIELLVNLNIPQHKIKNLMETISLDAIKHLTHIILNKRKNKKNTSPITHVN